jgi:hypothetical protein
VDDLVVDVTFVELSALAALVERFAHFTATLRDLAQVAPHDASASEAVRLFLGRVIFGSSVNAAQAQLSATSLRQVIIGYFNTRCIHASTKLQRAKRAGDIYAVFEYALAIYYGALQAFLAGCGELYFGQVWTWSKLRRAVDDETFQHLWHLGSATGMRVPRQRLVDMRIATAQSLLVGAQSYGWDEPNAASWPFIRIGRGSFHRDAAWLSLRLRDGMFLSSEAALLECTPAALYVWGASSGLSYSSMNQLDIADGTEGGLSPVAPSFRQYVEEFQRRGLVAKLKYGSI